MLESAYRTVSQLFTRILHRWCPLLFYIRYRVIGLKVIANGFERYAEMGNQRTIICPTHSTEIDGPQMFFFSGFVHEDFHYVAAKEMFDWWHGFYGRLLRLGGCFAVKRGLFDRHACQLMLADLVSGKNKLVIFPEGDISHHFDELLRIEPGAAQLGFWTLERLQAKGKNEPFSILPVGLSYAFAEDPAPHFDLVFSKVEKHVGLMPVEFSDRRERLNRLCAKLLEVIELTCNIKNAGLDLEERLSQVRVEILNRLSSSLGSLHSVNEIDLLHIIRGNLDHIIGRQSGGSPYENQLTLERRKLASLLIRDVIRVENLRFCVNKSSSKCDDQELAEALTLISRELLGKSILTAKKVAILAVGKPIELLPLLDLYKHDRRSAMQKVNSEIATQLEGLQANLVEEVHQLESELIKCRTETQSCYDSTNLSESISW